MQENKFKFYFNIILFFIIVLFQNFVLSFDEINCTYCSRITLKNFIPYQNNTIYPSYELQKGNTIFLNGVWKKQREILNLNLTFKNRTKENISTLEQEAKSKYKINYDDSKWEKIILPAIENKPVFPDGKNDRYQQGVWYRKNIFIPANWKNKIVKLNFLGANYVIDIWVNEKWVGVHFGGFSSFIFDVSNFLKYGKKNLIVIRLVNPEWDDGFFMRYPIIPYKKADWWNYTGIFRDVFLTASNKINIARTEIKQQEINLKSRTVKGIVKIFLENNFANKKKVKIKLQIYKAAINNKNILSPYAQDLIVNKKPLYKKNFLLVINHNSLFNANYFLNNVLFWSPETPQLYVFKISLYYDGNLKQNYFLQYGFKEIKINLSAKKLLLNGKPIFLKGVSRHEESPKNYRVVLPKEILTDLKLIKSIGANFLRTAHYPNHPFTYILSDRLGLLVWEEIPVYWFNGSDMQDIYPQIKNYFLEMILRDINRTSIIFWGTNNECVSPLYKKQLIKKLKTVHNFVDRTRFISQAAIGTPANIKDISNKEVDVIGVNLYYGVFTDSIAYGSASFYEGTKWALQQLNKNFPDKLILITEYGLWSGSVGEDWYKTQSQKQLQCFKDTFKAIEENPQTIGAVWWTAFDYLSFRSFYNSFGVFDFKRKNAKPIYNEMKKEFNSYP